MPKRACHLFVFFPVRTTITAHQHILHACQTFYDNSIQHQRARRDVPHRPPVPPKTNAPMCILSESFVIKRLHSEQKITRLTVNHKVTKQVGGCSFAGGFLEGGGGWLVSGQRAHVYNTHTHTVAHSADVRFRAAADADAVSGSLWPGVCARECVFFGWA